MSWHASCHILVPSGGYDNSVAGGRLVFTRCYFRKGG